MRNIAHDDEMSYCKVILRHSIAHDIKIVAHDDERYSYE